MRQHLHPAHFFYLFTYRSYRRRSRLHPQLVVLPGQPLNLRVFLFEFSPQRFSRRSSRLLGRGCPILARFLRKGGNHETRHHGFKFMIFSKMPQRSLARHRLHPPHARGHTTFLQNLDQPNLARRPSVGAPAQLGREVADLDHADAVAILFAKQRHGLVFVDGHVNWHVLDDLDPLVPEDFFINHVLDVLQFFVFDRREMRKIKAQMVRRHQRPRLLHMLAQHLAQPGMEQVRGRVIAHGGLPDRRVHHRVHFVAHANRMFGDYLMRAHALHRVVASLHLSHHGVQLIAVKHAAVPNLPARFGIKRRVIKNDFAFLTGLELLRTLPVLDDGQHFAIFGASLKIAFENRFWELLIRRIGGLLGRAFPRCAGTGTLFRHCNSKSLTLYDNSRVPTDVLDEIQRQTERVVQLEGSTARIEYLPHGITR